MLAMFAVTVQRCVDSWLRPGEEEKKLARQGLWDGNGGLERSCAVGGNLAGQSQKVAKSALLCAQE
jgi:hypothetical protein